MKKHLLFSQSVLLRLKFKAVTFNSEAKPVSYADFQQARIPRLPLRFVGTP